jgi:DHA1 family multidrug resistance protein-like MFS transporter
MIPFVAFFLARDLGVHRPSELALWTGGAAASSGLGQAIAGPIWGALGDRFGRKPLLLRAVLMGGVFMALTSLSRSPQELLLYRFAFGLLAGPMPIAMAIVASETPKIHVARSLGILNSAIALAAGIGPALGAVIVGIVDVRYVFAVAGAGLLISSIFVITMVTESPRRARSHDAKADSGRLAGALLATVTFILVAQGVASTVGTMVLPLVSLRFLELVPDRAASVTGAAFAISGVTTAIAGASFGSILFRLRYRRTAILSAFLLGVAVVAIAGFTALPPVFAAFAVYGFVNGLLMPVVSSLLAVEVPSRLHSTVFGMSASANALGYTAGPLLAGAVAAATSVAASLALAGVLSLLLAVLLGVRLREPLRSVPSG